MTQVYICWSKRTAIGRYGGALSTVRPDDMLAHVFRVMQQQNASVDWNDVDDVIIGCANQAGEDNRNVARMSVLLSGLPENIPATTINRLCGSGMDAVLYGFRAIKSGESDLIIAGGVESMSRAPFVMGKSESAFSRSAKIYDTTIGWRFTNRKLQQAYGVDTMPETAENVAEQFKITRADQDAYAYQSQQRYKNAYDIGFFKDEIIPYPVPQKKGDPVIFDTDEHPRPNTSLEGLSILKTPFRQNGSVTAGNASGVNDGAAAVILASHNAIHKYNLTPIGEIITGASAGCTPRIMGIGPVYAVQKVLQKSHLALDDIHTIELNEAFSAQVLACVGQLGLDHMDNRINPNGGAIALGHPLGMSGTRLILTALNQLHKTNGHLALCSMCIGVGQGIACIIKKV